MTLRSEMGLIVETWQGLGDRLRHNYILLDIFEGNLLCYIQEDLRRQLSAQSYDACKHRIAPLNVLRKIVDKMSKIYKPGPARTVVGGTEADAELLNWYVEQLNVNGVMQTATEFFNLTKSQLLQPYIGAKGPAVRAVASNRYFVMGLDKRDSMVPTHVVLVQASGDGTAVFSAYTATEFLVFNEKSEVAADYMAAAGNPEGINPYGVLPFAYGADSKLSIVPKPDSDMLTMTKLIPLLFSDLNYAVMFQAFSIMYGINVDDENLAMAPNAFWRFKADTTREGAPEIGQIKPQVDIEEVMSLIETELALWLNTKGIRPGAVGSLGKDNFANGISKMIDEMDTVEAREKLADAYTRIEEEFWETLLRHVHPVWVEQKLVDNVSTLSAGARVSVRFNVQMPSMDRATLVEGQEKEVKAGFRTRRGALRALNPLMTEQDLDKLETELDEARTAAADQNVQQQSLNGLQVEALGGIVAKVLAGQLPKEAARGILTVAFDMTDEEVAAILDKLTEGSVPVAPPPPKLIAPPGPPAPAPAPDGGAAA